MLIAGCDDTYMVWNTLLKHGLISSTQLLTRSEADHFVLYRHTASDSTFNWWFMLIIRIICMNYIDILLQICTAMIKLV